MIRYKEDKGIVETGRIMIHPAYRRQGLAKWMLSGIDRMYRMYPQPIRELYTCTKSWINIKLYEHMGYKSYKEHYESSGLSFVYMRKQ